MGTTSVLPESLRRHYAVAPPAATETLPAFAVIVIALEGEQTADERIVDPGALTWREPPITLTVNHDPEHVAGKLDPVGRVASLAGLTVDNVAARIGTAGNYVVALAQFDLGYDSAGNLVNENADGREVARMVDGGFLRGISMEVGNELIEWECVAEDVDGFCEQMLMHLVQGQIGAVTVAPFQAIESAEVVDVSAPGAAPVAAHAGKAGWWACPEPTVDRTPVVAGAVASQPALLPHEAFFIPEPDEYQPFERNGWHVSGHLAPKDVCHVGIQDYCRTCPTSNTDYAYFHQVPVETDDGQLMVGLLCTDQLHVDLAHDDGSPIEADEARRLAYENPGARAAYLRVIDGAHGPWACGVLHPSVSEAQLARLDNTPVSGDWRPIRMGSGDFVGTELISVTCVNYPGFPHAKALSAGAGDGRQLLALVGSLAPQPGCGCGGGHASTRAAAAQPADLLDRVRRIETIISVTGLDATAMDQLVASMQRPRRHPLGRHA